MKGCDYDDDNDDGDDDQNINCDDDEVPSWPQQNWVNIKFVGKSGSSEGKQANLTTSLQIQPAFTVVMQWRKIPKIKVPIQNQKCQ